jgi:tRNA pseudouridine38-40 synthase
VALFGASRTDSGVHARGQVAAFTCAPLELADGTFDASEQFKGVGWPPERGVERLVSAINSRLPDDVVVRSASLVRPQFDPVGDAVRKAYSYTFCVSHERPIAGREGMMHVARRSSIDVQAMHRAAVRLIGEHDFAAFAASGHGRKSTVRSVDHAAVFVVEDAGLWPKHGTRTCGPRVTQDQVQVSPSRGPDFAALHARQIVRLEIAGNGFLWNMVRIIAGTLLQVGLGAMDEACITTAIASCNRKVLGPTAPPEGLCLEWIEYGGAGGRGEALGNRDQAIAEGFEA